MTSFFQLLFLKITPLTLKIMFIDMKIKHSNETESIGMIGNIWIRWEIKLKHFTPYNSLN